jgi:hypothetical protein
MCLARTDPADGTAQYERVRPRPVRVDGLTSTTFPYRRTPLPNEPVEPISGSACCSWSGRRWWRPSPPRAANTVVLDATGRQNLRIQTAVAEPGDFEETVFALGRLEARPGHQAAVTSRISGRVVALGALPGDRVEARAEVLQVESRSRATTTAIHCRLPSGHCTPRGDLGTRSSRLPGAAEITDSSSCWRWPAYPSTPWLD